MASISGADRIVTDMTQAMCTIANVSSALMHTDISAIMCKFALMDDQQNDARNLVQQMLTVMETDATNLARLAKVSPSTLTRFMNAPVKHSLSLRTLNKLSRVSGVPIPSAAVGRRQEEKTTPIVGYVGAGEEIFPIDGDSPDESLEQAETPPGSDEDTVAVIVRGESMFPVFWDGDLLFYTRDGAFDPEECLYQECVVKIVNGPMMIKRVMPGRTKFVFSLHSYNAQPLLDREIEWASPVKFHDMRRRRAKPQLRKNQTRPAKKVD